MADEAPSSTLGEHPLATLADELHAIAFHLVRALRRADAAAGANGPELSALSVLARGHAPTMRELAEAEHVTPPTMTRLVQRMEREGLAVRELDARDRRTVRVSLTRRGRALLRAGNARRVAELRRRLRGVSPEDVAVLERAFGVLQQILPVRAPPAHREARAAARRGGASPAARGEADKGRGGSGPDAASPT
jgi:DNA-binding MarR family transcriptional regulator